MWGPPVISWFISSNYSYLRTINHSEIGVIGTNLATLWLFNIAMEAMAHRKFDGLPN